MGKRLSELVEQVIDNRGKNPKYLITGKYPVIDNFLIKNNLYPNLEEVNRYIDEETFKNFLRGYIKKNMPIMTLVGNGIGNISLAPTDQACIVQNTIGFKTTDELDELYLFYYLKFIQEDIKKLDRGSGQPSIKKTDILNLIIKYPEKNIQNKIINILYNIDRKININNQINDNLLKLNNQLYEEYFINNINQYDDEINLKDLINVVNGYSYKGIELVDKSDTCLATIKNFDRKGSFKEDGFKPLNPQRIKEEQIVEKNDILVACTDLTQQADIIGNAVLLLGNGKYKKIIISMDLVKIIPKDNINKYVIFSILNSKDFKKFALGYRSGTTVLHLNKKCFNDYKFKMPDNKKLNIFSNIVRMNYERISSILEENRKLNELRDTLLPKLMNGEINLDKIKI